jgi:hypothetical protein
MELTIKRLPCNFSYVSNQEREKMDTCARCEKPATDEIYCAEHYEDSSASGRASAVGERARQRNLLAMWADSPVKESLPRKPPVPLRGVYFFQSQE